MKTVTIHYFAAAKAAAGVGSEEISGEFSTLGELVELVSRQHDGATEGGMSLEAVLDRCAWLIDGHSAELGDVLPENASRVDALPPFAGG